MTTHARAVACFVGATLLCGCSAMVTCPPAGADARPVYLLDHGKHASLVLARADGGAVRYSYGDRRWYAEGDTGIGAGFNALFRATPAVLMRRALPGGSSLDAVIHATGFEVERAFVLSVPAARVDALATALDTLYAAGADEPRPEYAAHPAPYSMRHNSNHAVADWLGELGCDTRGSPMTSNWRVAD